MTDTVGSAAVAAAREVLTGYLAEAGIPWEPGARRDEYVVTLPGEHKLQTTVSVVVGVVGLSVSSFVIRNPDENHVEVYRYLLRRNLRLRGLAYGVDRLGDVYVRGHLPLAGVDTRSLDLLFGAVLEAVDDRFDDLLTLGFLSAMKREWDWRVATGQPTANLESFRAVLDPAGAAPVPGPEGRRGPGDGTGTTMEDDERSP